MESNDKQLAYDRKIFKDACSQIAAYMDALGYYELIRSEQHREILQSWDRVWDVLDPDRTAETVDFKVKGLWYLLTRDV